MTHPSERFIRRWQQERKLGRLRYIVMKGILFYGFMTAMIFMLLNAVWDNVKHDRPLFAADGLAILDLTYMTLIFVFVVVAAGYAWGAFVWRINEKVWLKFEQDQGD